MHVHTMHLQTLLHPLMMAVMMAWEILWALCLGFLVSAVVEAVVSKEQIGKLMPDSSPKTIVIASGLGAASSSCSYAAVAIARSLFRKGADFIAAMAFQFASTNLVLELSILLAVLLGWQFMLAEFVGGPVMIMLLVVLLRITLRPRVLEAARKQAERNLAGKMEGHAAMDMSLHQGTFWQKFSSNKGQTAISHYYFMNWSSLWGDIALGLLISGVLAAWVPQTFWQGFFLAGHPLLAKFWGPLIGPLVAVLSFVCSVGNVPLAAVLWNGGISFGGVIAFLFADLIILPIVNIYRRYYGGKVAAILFLVFYSSMSLAALAVEGLFGLLHLIPEHGHASIMQESVRWNYTSMLNIVFLVLSLPLFIRFLKTGGPAMLRMMDEAPSEEGHHHHCH
ncbi:permease [Terriglobus saanensis]|uniref:Permease n=1 Tax=Terriglobus saanensis (strain ATCC BAA-1853 / DSM 23119 / SP1PR4) TaxID=401053 RepID=E8UXK3_TERSS|nr:permease [Terriglobus saanensis]ADV81947.1 permease [Terriglobus saanensis SP1PR4]